MGIVEEDWPEYLCEALLHVRVQARFILQSCQQLLLRLWVVECHLAQELVDYGIEHLLVTWQHVTLPACFVLCCNICLEPSSLLAG